MPSELGLNGRLGRRVFETCPFYENRFLLRMTVQGGSGFINKSGWGLHRGAGTSYASRSGKVSEWGDDTGTALASDGRRPLHPKIAQ